MVLERLDTHTAVGGGGGTTGAEVDTQRKDARRGIENVRGLYDAIRAWRRVAFAEDEKR